MMVPTREDFDNLSLADFMDLAEAEHRAAVDWDQREDDLAYREAERRARNRRYAWRFVGVLVAAAIILTLLAAGAMPAGAHDLAAWSDPARDQWYRSLKVPGQSTSCCDFTDAAAMNPDMVRQENDGSWWVDLGAGFVPVPPERVVRVPVSIDGLPYIFMMDTPTADSPNAIRCLVPPVGTY